MLDAAEIRKARGAFFTPPQLSEFVTDWAVRAGRDTVFEPSCGEAAFLFSAGARLRTLTDQPLASSQLQGIDIHPQSVAAARRLLQEHGLSNQLTVGDFFDVPSTRAYDAVVGNPPYIRYQIFSGDVRVKAQKAALAQGVRLTGLASSWAAFVVHASTLLKPSGRLGLVLPAELLTVNYAAPVRRFLMERFAKVRLILFESRVFPGVLEEVVLLLAEVEGPTDHFELYQARDVAGVRDPEPRICVPADAQEKWVQALLPTDTLNTYARLSNSPAFCDLVRWGQTDLGMVTGNNHFFGLTTQRVRELGLKRPELLPISPPSSRHLRGLTFTEKTWQEMATDDSRVYLFYPNRKTPSEAALKYIRKGEHLGVHKAYKCRVRSPWWRVPIVRVPDLFLTYMNHDAPRLVANRGRVRHLNSIHGVTLEKEYRQLGLDLLPMAILNSVTLLGSELVGRTYGGGILKLEPKEADVLPVPSPETVQEVASPLRALRPQLARYLRTGDLTAVVKLVDRILLTSHLKIWRNQIQALRMGRELLFSRRVARSAKIP